MVYDVPVGRVSSHITVLEMDMINEYHCTVCAVGERELQMYDAPIHIHSTLTNAETSCALKDMVWVQSNLRIASVCC